MAEMNTTERIHNLVVMAALCGGGFTALYTPNGKKRHVVYEPTAEAICGVRVPDIQYNPSLSRMHIGFYSFFFCKRCLEPLVKLGYAEYDPNDPVIVHFDLP